MIELKVKSAIAWYPTSTLEVTDLKGTKHEILFDTQVHVILLEPNDSDGWNEEPLKKDMQARELAPLLAKGYYIMQIAYGEAVQ